MWADVHSAVNMLVVTSILPEKSFSMRHLAFTRAATVAVARAATVTVARAATVAVARAATVAVDVEVAFDVDPR